MYQELIQHATSNLSSKAREAIRNSPIKPGDKVIISKGPRKEDKEHTINRIAHTNGGLLFFIGGRVYGEKELTKIEPSTPITIRIEIKFK